MTSANKIISELSTKKRDLFKSFFLKYKYNFNFEKLKKFKKFKTIIIIGMGGSILGSKAIYDFLRFKIKKKFIFIDNSDQSYLEEVKKKNNLKNSLFLIISKSGNTIETIVNASFFQKFINNKNSIIVSENKNNILRNYAIKKKIYFVKHNSKIGGRYSVFSESGILPAYFMGLNIKKFKNRVLSLIKNKKILTSEIKKINKIISKRNKVLILFNYVPELNNFMFWSQQLLAESLGKNKKGFMTVVSNAPKDHHSLLQLYLDGPRDKTFYVFSSKDKKKLNVNSKMFSEKMKFLHKKKYEHVKLSQKNAFIKTLKEKKIIYNEILVKKFDESTLGELFFLFIFQTLVFSKILKVNAFNQPAVERVKVLTKKFLV